MSNSDELIAQFIEISGGEESVARFYLSSNNWSLEDALSSFLGNQTDDNGLVAGTGTSPRAASLPPSATGASSRIEKDDENFGNKNAGKPRFATLNDMSKRQSNEDEGQAFYAGGSERSGQQVLGPPKRKNFREQLTDMFRMAQEQHSGETSTSSGPSTSSGVNWGQGMRLGMTDSDHSAIPSQKSDNTTGEKKPIVVLKLWSQGFSIDDGELRLYDDPENKEFLETVMRGEIPHELLEMGWMVNVDVEDHRHEDYKRLTKSKTFKGSGHTLGSPAPTVEGAAEPQSNASNLPPENTSNNEKNAKDKLNVNTTMPITTLQIRLADGSRLTAQFNLTHTLADIHQYIQNARPQYANGNFRLVSSFPTRELTDNAATIEEAGLKNAAIMQRLN